jgi:hypothetical protein
VFLFVRSDKVLSLERTGTTDNSSLHPLLMRQRCDGALIQEGEASKACAIASAASRDLPGLFSRKNHWLQPNSGRSSDFRIILGLPFPPDKR